MLNVKKCMCWCLSIIELKNARWNIEILYAEFWPPQPIPSTYFYPGQGSSNLALVTYVRISSLTSSSQRIFGLLIGLLEMGFKEYIALTILVSCILSMWPSHPNLCALMKIIMFLYFIILSNSWLDFWKSPSWQFFSISLKSYPSWGWEGEGEYPAH